MKDTRDKIAAAARECFMEKGFEQTSVRMILEKSGVTTGSFYHFFPSKEALFEAVIEAFIKDYVAAFAAICENHALPVMQRCELLFRELARRVGEYYGPLGGAHLHWSVAYSLHEKAIASMLPSVAVLLTDALNSNTVNSRLDVSVETLSLLLIRGMEAILHGGGDDTLAEETESRISKCREFLNLLLEIRE